MKLRTILVGAGKVGAGFADDPVMARFYPYSSHAQVLAEHPDLEWGAVVDTDRGAVDRVRERWNVPRGGANLAEVCRAYEPEVAVVATPPAGRTRLLDDLRGVRALLVEKPLGVTHEEALEFAEACRARRILLAVNIWRRADERLQEIAAHLKDIVGSPQTAFAVYGNGLHNNGTHMVDLVRMLLGEITSVRAAPESLVDAHGPIPGDIHVAATLVVEEKLAVHLAPLDFREFRENGIDIWGTKARVGVWQEGLRVSTSARVPNRAMQGEREIASDEARWTDGTPGKAFFRMYDNLVAAVRGDAALVSPADSAIRTTRVVDLIERSAREDGRVIRVTEAV